LRFRRSNDDQPGDGGTSDEVQPAPLTETERTPPSTLAPDPSERDWETLSTGERIQALRLQRGWTLERTAWQMEHVATSHGGNASRESLKAMLIRWEHDQNEPGEFNRRVVAETFDVTVAHLGMRANPYFRWITIN
jgi:hypothetical protein